jgi:hypothetical protein
MKKLLNIHDLKCQRCGTFDFWIDGHSKLKLMRFICKQCGLGRWILIFVIDDTTSYEDHSLELVKEEIEGESLEAL